MINFQKLFFRNRIGPCKEDKRIRDPAAIVSSNNGIKSYLEIFGQLFCASNLSKK